MREDRRSEPGLANGRVEAGRMQESIQALGPQSNPMLFVHPCCTNPGLRRTRRLPTKCRLCSSSHSPRPDPKGNPDVCAPWVHKLGPESEPGDIPESVCVPESPRVLSSVRDCSGFAITDHLRVLFAKCQAPYFIRSDRKPGQRGSIT